jgi:membrane protease YdiL (CAAX protease family)
MSILKAALATLIFILVWNLISCWIVLAYYYDISDVYFYYGLINNITMLCLVAFFLFRSKRITELLPKQTHFKWYIIAMMLGACFLFVQAPLNWVYNFVFQSNYNIDFDGFRTLTVIKLMAAVLFGPITEELFFRGYIQEALQKKFKPLITISVTALLFAFIHFEIEAIFFESFSVNPHHMYITFFGGLISGFLYFKAKSVLPSIMMHMCWNLVAYSL